MSRLIGRRLAAVLLTSILLAAGCGTGAPRGGPPPGQQGEGSGTQADQGAQPEDPGAGQTQPGGKAEEEPASDSTPAPSVPAQQPALPATPPSIAIEPARVLQGDFAVLRFDRAVDGPVTVAVEGLGEQPKPFLLEGRPVAFIGFPANARTGTYPVRATWPDGAWEGKVEVIPKQFTEDRLVVTEEQEAIYYDPRQEEEWRKVFRLRSTSEERPLWRGAFQPPLQGDLTITTYFGEIRYVNGVETGRHSGMDFAAETGTPVLAPARGKVILAEKLIVTGWTVIIDHGFNLFTAYYHCDRVDVAPGDLVEAGDQIGTVGSTGFSTGPHLHWTATIGNTPVDPWPLTQRPPLGILPLSERLTPDQTGDR